MMINVTTVQPYKATFLAIFKAILELYIYDFRVIMRRNQELIRDERNAIITLHLAGLKYKEIQ